MSHRKKNGPARSGLSVPPLELDSLWVLLSEGLSAIAIREWHFGWLRLSAFVTGSTAFYSYPNPWILSTTRHSPGGARIQSVRSYYCVRTQIYGNSRRFSFWRTSRTKRLRSGRYSRFTSSVGVRAALANRCSWSAFAPR